MSTPSSNQYFEAIWTSDSPPTDPNLFTAAELVAGSFDSAAVSSATSKAVSTVNAAAPDSTSMSQARSQAVSAATNASIADSKGVSGSGTTSVADSKALSGSVNTSIADSKAVSVAVATPTVTAVVYSAAISTADSKAVSAVAQTAAPAGARTVPDTKTYLANNAVYNVKDFGAKGDGSTNDLAAINATIAAIPAAGGRLHFPAGTYIVQTRILITLKDNLTISGEGWGATIIKVVDGASSVGSVFDIYDSNNTVIRDFAINGNRTNQAAGWNEFNPGIRWGAGNPTGRATNENLLITGMHIYNCAGDCILLTGSQGATVATIRNITIANNVLEDPNTGGAGVPRMGVALVSGTNVEIIGNTIKGTAAATGQWGVDLESDASPAGLLISDVTVTGNTITDMNGVRLLAANSGAAIDHVTITANTIRTHATAIQGAISTVQWCTSVIIADNQILVQNAGGASGYGILVDIGGSGITIADNDIKVLSAGVGGTGILVGGGADSIEPYMLKITGNHVHHCKTNGIQTKRPFTLISGNFCRANGADGIVLDNATDASYGCLVIGNTSIVNTGWGINVLGIAVANYTILGNQLGTVNSGYNNTAGAINDQSKDFRRLVSFNQGGETSIAEQLVISVWTTAWTIDASTGNAQELTGSTAATAFTVNAPTNPQTGLDLDITIKNTSAGVLGAATWNAVFKMVAWTNPAAGFSRSIRFRYDGANWVEKYRAAADVPN